MNIHHSDDAEKMFEEAKVISPNKKAAMISAPANTQRQQSKSWLGRKSSNNTSTTSATSGQTSTGGRPGSADSYDCEICFLTLPRSMMTGLECGHLYCSSCWTEYLTTKIVDEGASQMIECPVSTIGTTFPIYK